MCTDNFLPTVDLQEEQIWQLLANILQTAGIVSCEDNAPLGGDFVSLCFFKILAMALNAGQDISGLSQDMKVHLYVCSYPKTHFINI